MSMSPLARRYARAIIDLAKEGNLVDRVGRDLNDFADMWKSSPELRELFANPKFPYDARKKVLTDLTTRAAASPIAKNSLLYLNDKGRLPQVADIADAYTELAEAASGKVRAEVISAAPLGESYYLQLQKTLEQVTGKQVTVEKKTDPSLIAGVVTRVGDKVFDGSVRTRLTEIKESLTSAE